MTHCLEDFVAQNVAKNSMVITLFDYVCLHHFFMQEWSLVAAKLHSNVNKMRSGNQPVMLTPHLSFYNHGYAMYTTTLGNHLKLSARTDSQDKCLDRITCWLTNFLEITLPTAPAPTTLTTTTTGTANKELEIPVVTLAQLFADKRAFDTLYRLVYKDVHPELRSSV